MRHNTSVTKHIHTHTHTHTHIYIYICSIYKIRDSAVRTATIYELYDQSAEYQLPFASRIFNLPVPQQSSEAKQGHIQTLRWVLTPEVKRSEREAYHSLPPNSIVGLYVRMHIHLLGVVN
jgi:hypothetical protein